MNKTHQAVMVKYKEAHITSKSSQLGSLRKKCFSGDVPFWPIFISFVWDSVFVDNYCTAVASQRRNFIEMRIYTTGRRAMKKEEWA